LTQTVLIKRIVDAIDIEAQI